MSRIFFSSVGGFNDVSFGVHVDHARFLIADTTTCTIGRDFFYARGYQFGS